MNKWIREERSERIEERGEEGGREERNRERRGMNVVAGIRKERERVEFEVLTLLFFSSFSSLYVMFIPRK